MLLFFIAILSILMLLCEMAALNYKHKNCLMSALIFSIKRYLYLHLKWGGGGAGGDLDISLQFSGSFNE